MDNQLHVSPFTVATEDNCFAGEHTGWKVVERRKAKRIRKFYPDWVFAIWQCNCCDKIKTAT